MRYDGTMTPTNDTKAEILAAAERLGFFPGRWDNPKTGSRILDRTNADGYPVLRIAVDNDGETRVIAFTGTKAQIVEWQASFTHAPAKAILALIKASL